MARTQSSLAIPCSRARRVAAVVDGEGVGRLPASPPLDHSELRAMAKPDPGRAHDRSADSLSDRPTSLRLNAGVLDHLAPFVELDLDELVHLLRRTGKRLEPRAAQLRLHLLAVDDLAQLRI